MVIQYAYIGLQKYRKATYYHHHDDDDDDEDNDGEVN